jgi:hypothetical protein
VKPFFDISGQVRPEGDDSNGLLTESEIWFSYSDITRGKNVAAAFMAGFWVLIEVQREMSHGVSSLLY